MKTLTITQNKHSQAQISPAEALYLLKEGNARFVENRRLPRDLMQQVRETAEGQYPFAAVLSCIDSRIPTEMVFDQGVGDIFNARIAGNLVNQDILGSLEFACKLSGSKLVVVLGHTSCGAIKGACDEAKLGNLTGLLRRIEPAVLAVRTPVGIDRSSANLRFVDDVAKENVRRSIRDIKEQSTVLYNMFHDGQIDILGAMYDVSTGKVEFFQ